MARLDKNGLILAVTYKCNLRCNYCQISKKNESMDFETAWRAVSLFSEEKNRIDKPLIRFFGGEPLLNFDLIKKVILSLGKNKKNFFFDITTNGLLLNNKILEFLSGRRNVEVVISSNQRRIFNKKGFSKKILKLPVVTINFNLLPGKLGDSELLFNSLLEKGFRRFNFLPASYVEWQPEQLKALNQAFRKIRQVIFSSKEEIFIKNKEINLPVPLFGVMPTVAPSGDIYAGNVFMDKRFSVCQNELKLGNIQNIKDWESIVASPLSLNLDYLLKKILPQNILGSALAVDLELNKFVESLK